MTPNYTSFSNAFLAKVLTKASQLFSQAKLIFNLSVLVLFFSGNLVVSGQVIEGKTECDLKVDLGNDQTICNGESVTLTPQITGESNCEDCKRYAINDSKNCRTNKRYSITFKYGNKRYHLVNTRLKWVEYNAGEAILTGLAEDSKNSKKKYKVSVRFRGGTYTPPPHSPKEHLCNSENTNGWKYFSHFNGTIESLDKKLKLKIKNTGPAFQLGNGANEVEKEPGKLGASGWFVIENGKGGSGDFNINIGECQDPDSGGELTYLWSTGETTPTITVSDEGEYWVKVKDCNQKCKAKDKIKVQVNDPSIDAGDDVSIFAGDTIQLDPIPGADKVEWIVDGEVIFTADSDQDAPEVSPAVTTTYEVVATFGDCKVSDSVTVTVKTCDFSVDLGEDRTICNGQAITLTAFTGGNDDGGCTRYDLENTNYCSGINTYLVSLGDQQNRVYLVNQSVQWQEINEKESELSGIAVNSEDPNDAYEISVVFSEKTMTPPQGSPKMHACNQVDPTGWAYFLSFTGTIRSLQTGELITVERRGEAFQVGKGANDTEQASDKIGGSGWFVTNESNYEIGDFNFNLGNCVSTSSTLTYQWSTGEDTPSIVVNTAGEYTVTVTNSDGCVATDSVTVTASDVVIDAGEDVTIKEGESIKLLPIPGGADIIEWLVDGDVFFATGSPSSSPEVSPEVTTTYTVRARFGECIAEDTVTITVEACDDFVIDAGDDVTIAIGSSVQLNPIPDADYREWSVDGEVFFTTVSPTKSPEVSPTETTTYTVLARFGPCEVEDTITITVKGCDEIIIDAGEDITIKPGESTTLSPIPDADYREWSVDGIVFYTTVSPSKSPEVSPTETTTYTVTARIGDCEVQDTVTVNVDSCEITIDVGEDKTITAGDSVQLDPVAEGEYREWSVDGEVIFATVSPTQSPIVSPTKTTVYTVTVTIGICTITDTITVTVEPCGEVVDLGDDVTICSGETVTLATQGGFAIEWSTGETTPSIEVAPNESTVYTVVVSADSGCQVTDSVTVIVEDPFTVSVGEDIIICPGDEVTVEAIVNGSGASEEFSLTDTKPCNVSTDENFVLWLYDGNVNRYFSNIDLNWQQFNNGIARLTGTVLDYTLTQQVYSIDVTFTGGTAVLPPSEGPKPNICTNEVAQDWFYYPQFSGTISALDGSWETEVTRRGEAFQVGVGANNIESRAGLLGGSGWFGTTDTQFTIGDFNFNVGDLMEKEYTYQWSTGDSTQTVVLTPGETATYEVVVTYRGCSVTDEITITVGDAEDCPSGVTASSEVLQIFPTLLTEDNRELSVSIISDNDQKVQMALYDLNGTGQQPVIIKNVRKGVNIIKYRVDTDKAIHSGMYMLKVWGKTINETKKIIKE